MEIYLIKANIILALFYCFYRLMFGNDTFFVWRRWMLVGAYVLSFIIPMANIAYWMEDNVLAGNMAEMYTNVLLPVVQVGGENGNGFVWQKLLSVVYVGGAGLLFVRFLYQLASILHLAKTTKVRFICDARVHILSAEGSPFSFFNLIFINPEHRNSEQLTQIVAHERTHVVQYHSFDVVLSELFTMLCWANPFAWMLRKEVRINLEYLADDSVLAKGSARKTYQYHLLWMAYGADGHMSLTNKFNVLPLKKRIKMMNKQRTSELLRGKYLLLCPLAAALLAVSNIETVARTLQKSVPAEAVVAVKNTVWQSQKTKKPTTRGKVVATKIAAKPAKKAFEAVEVMPEFPGGMQALMAYLGENTHYPAEAYKANVQGRVIVDFVVEADGSVTEATVVRSVTPELDEEALRVVSSMPKWNPGKVDGKAVRVQFKLPVSFKMEKAVPAVKLNSDPDKEPLVVIDGVVSDSKAMADLRPEGIEHVTILKNEDSKKQYGENVKNGVVVIKTKKTIAGK